MSCSRCSDSWACTPYFRSCTSSSRLESSLPAPSRSIPNRIPSMPWKHCWFCLLALMLATYLVLDGFDFGVGILHLLGRQERIGATTGLAIDRTGLGRQRSVVARVGRNDVPCLSEIAGDRVCRILSAADDRALAPDVSRPGDRTASPDPSSPLGAVLGCRVRRREPAIGGRHWRGVGNVVRGVSFNEDGTFFAPLWTDFRVSGKTGILDWFTILYGVATAVALTHHGALWLVSTNRCRCPFTRPTNGANAVAMGDSAHDRRGGRHLFGATEYGSEPAGSSVEPRVSGHRVGRAARRLAFSGSRATSPRLRCFGRLSLRHDGKRRELDLSLRLTRPRETSRFDRRCGRLRPIYCSHHRTLLVDSWHVAGGRLTRPMSIAPCRTSSLWPATGEEPRRVQCGLASPWPQPKAPITKIKLQTDFKRSNLKP